MQPLQTKGNCAGWACHDDKGNMVPFTFSRRKCRPDDVVLQITYCGMCHSDLHQIKNDWGNSIFPMVPGHELMGVVVDVGQKVSKFKVGDLAAIGCMVDSCGSCNNCNSHEEQYCAKGFVGTYNGKCVPIFVSISGSPGQQTERCLARAGIAGEVPEKRGSTDLWMPL